MEARRAASASCSEIKWVVTFIFRRSLNNSLPDVGEPHLTETALEGFNKAPDRRTARSAPITDGSNRPSTSQHLGNIFKYLTLLGFSRF